MRILSPATASTALVLSLLATLPASAAVGVPYVSNLIDHASRNTSAKCSPAHKVSHEDVAYRSGFRPSNEHGWG